MPLSGKYDFPGIKKLNAAAIKLWLAASPITSWVLYGGAFTDVILEFIGNAIANMGLVIINLGDIFIEGGFDQQSFDKALDEGIKAIEIGRDKITPEKGKAIDDSVRAAARKFIKFNPS